MRILIAGGGLVAARAAESARNHGFDGEIAIVGDEPHPPYHRPPLSKEVLAAPPGDDLWIHPVSWFADHGVELIRGRRAVRLDPAERRVHLDDGARVPYDRLLVATGSVVRRLHLPGSDLDGVHHLRTLDDSLAVARRLASANDVVVVGAGLIGLEVASAARALGKRVTVLDGAATPLLRVVGPRVGETVARMHRDAGVDLRMSAFTERFLGTAGIEAVELGDGTRIPADLVVVGIGVRPATDWLRDSGLALDDGVLVDTRLATNLPDVYAAGDVAKTWVPQYGQHVRIEHYGNAHAAGMAAGEALAGGEVRYAPIPGASSTQLGRRIQVAGWVRGDEDVVMRGTDERFTAYFLRGERVTAAVSIDGGKEFLAAKRLVASGGRLEREARC